jgi:hypothetical protein
MGKSSANQPIFIGGRRGNSDYGAGYLNTVTFPDTSVFSLCASKKSAASSKLNSSLILTHRRTVSSTDSMGGVRHVN